MTFDFSIPTNDSHVQLRLESGESAIFVGANGAGKTRLAVHIELSNEDRAHRISAHRALSLNPAVAKIPEADALVGLRDGNFQIRDRWQDKRKSYRWQNTPATALLNDFDYLVQALFAEQARTALETHYAASAQTLTTVKQTKLQRLQGIWERLIPHRKLHISGDDIHASVAGPGERYSAAEMSDGERAIFYLIGQVLVAEPDSLLVVDEPELHVHRSILNKLWDNLENERPDCAFIFITHDLDFAASRIGQKYVIRDFLPTPAWVIESVPEDTGFPEDITTLLLGSRRPILFVEGDENSLDKAVYRCIYPNWTVVPRGSCKDVVHAIASLRNNPILGRIHCAGIIDADGYTAEDAGYYCNFDIYILPVSELENVFLLPEVSREIAVAEHLSPDEIDTRLRALAEDLFEIAANPDVIAASAARHCLRRIDRQLKAIDLGERSSIEQIDTHYRAMTQSLDPRAIAEAHAAHIRSAIDRRDLGALLSRLDNKGMLAKAASRLRNTRLDAFESWLARVLLNDRAPRLLAQLRQVLPDIPMPPA